MRRARGSAGGARASIYLVGFMASGKSEAGRRLGAALEIPFEDVDTWIEEGAAASVEEIWQSEGEALFRAREVAALLGLAGRRAVIATGGGAPLLPESRDLLRSTGLVLWLKVPFELLWKRGSPERNRARPLWRDRRSLEAHFEARQAAYAFADVTCEVGAGEGAAVTAHRLEIAVREWEAKR